MSVFTIQGQTVNPRRDRRGGRREGRRRHGRFHADGKTALVSRQTDNKVSVLSIDGNKVEYTKRDMTPGVRPIVLDVAGNGAFAVVGSLAGAATGDSDSISLIDLSAKPPRVVDTIGVLGATAEGLKISPDSSVVAVVVHNGSNRAKESPFTTTPKARDRPRPDKTLARARRTERQVVAGHRLSPTDYDLFGTDREGHLSSSGTTPCGIRPPREFHAARGHPHRDKCHVVLDV